MTNLSKENHSRLDTIDMVATGRRIKFLVKNRDISQSQLAKILDRDVKTISNYYRGVSLPDKNDFLILSKLLGKPYDDILVFIGDIEGYQRVELYSIEYNEDDGESLEDGISKAKSKSKFFNPHTKGQANIRNLEEAGFCLEYLDFLDAKDIKIRMMDELLSGNGVNSTYMHHIFETYIWRKLTNEQKSDCIEMFQYMRGEKEEMPEEVLWRWAEYDNGERRYFFELANYHR